MMPRFLRIKSTTLFQQAEAERFPQHITILADHTARHADIDVVICSHNQADIVNLIVNNYMKLESDARLHFYLVESSRNPFSFFRLCSGPCITRVQFLSRIPCTEKKEGGRFWASNGVALAAHIGLHFATSKYFFLSHADMMAYKKNFLSFLLSKLSEQTPLASFTQRHILPFTGCMLYDRTMFEMNRSSWLPLHENSYQITSVNSFKDRIDALQWLDVGEQLILDLIQQNRRAFVCASRGGSLDKYEHPLNSAGIDISDLHNAGLPVNYANLVLSRGDFILKYPELAGGQPASWRKCFDDEDDVVFIHQGRGASRNSVHDKREHFKHFLRAFNARNI